MTVQPELQPDPGTAIGVLTEELHRLVDGRMYLLAILADTKTQAQARIVELSIELEARTEQINVLHARVLELTPAVKPVR